MGVPEGGRWEEGEGQPFPAARSLPPRPGCQPPGWPRGPAGGVEGPPEARGEEEPCRQVCAVGSPEAPSLPRLRPGRAHSRRFSQASHTAATWHPRQGRVLSARAGQLWKPKPAWTGHVPSGAELKGVIRLQGGSPSPRVLTEPAWRPRGMRAPDVRPPRADPRAQPGPPLTAGPAEGWGGREGHSRSVVRGGRMCEPWGTRPHTRSRGPVCVSAVCTCGPGGETIGAGSRHTCSGLVCIAACGEACLPPLTSCLSAQGPRGKGASGPGRATGRRRSREGLWELREGHPHHGDLRAGGQDAGHGRPRGQPPRY